MYFAQYTRLTLIADDSGFTFGQVDIRLHYFDTFTTRRLTHSIQSSQNAMAQLAAPFDILAVRPTNEKMLQMACATLEVDIISLDLSSRLDFYLKHTTLGQAVTRGIFFEVTYSAAIKGK